MSFAERVLAFVHSLNVPSIALPEGFSWMFPYEHPEVRRMVALFYRKYYADERPRFFFFGINPGRFGAGTTGIAFTDPAALADECGIAHRLPRQRELSAQFIWQVVRAAGGAEPFFRHVYLTALSPLGLLRNGLNINYYDHPDLLRAVRPLIVWNIQTQIAFGAHRRMAVCLGEGQNFRVFKQLNAEHNFFEHLIALPHPRWIMQYRRKSTDRYVEQYVQTLQDMVASSAGAP
jgi:hypothetical protein